MTDRHQRHFETEHLRSDLRGRSIRGGGVTLAAQIVKTVMRFGCVMLLARLLAPADFGLVAMVTAVTVFAEMFKDAGLSMATVQREEITHEQVSTLFWINVGLSLLLVLAVAGLAPALAWFFGEPRLVGITLVVSLSFLPGGLTVQHQALLRRQMRFKELAVVELVSMGGGIGCGVALALNGFGYWALVGMLLATTVLNCVLVWILSGWLPGKPVRNCGVRGMIGFGGSLTVATFCNHLRENLPFIFIGQALGVGALALYERAYRLLVLPLNHLMPPMGAVAVPMLSRLQREPERFVRTVRRLIALASAFAVPASVVGVLAAPELVSVALGDQWGGVVLILAFLSPLGATQAVASVAIWALSASGRGLALMTFSLWNALLAAGSVGIGLLFGLEMAALAFAAVGVVVRTPMLFAFLTKHTSVGWRDVLEEAGFFVLGGALLIPVGLLLRFKWLGYEEPNLIWAGGMVCAVGLLWLLLLWWRGVGVMVREILAGAGRWKSFHEAT